MRKLPPRRIEGFHPDFLSVEPERFQIQVDRVREAIAFGAGRPYESARRVARILRADLLGVEGANALLKSLEEPGARFRWILTTTRPESLLPTIRSRAAAVALPSRSRAERENAWIERGFSEDDARDLVQFLPEEGAEAEARSRGGARRGASDPSGRRGGSRRRPGGRALGGAAPACRSRRLTRARGCAAPRRNPGRRRPGRRSRERRRHPSPRGGREAGGDRPPHRARPPSGTPRSPPPILRRTRGGGIAGCTSRRCCWGCGRSG